ncbi:MAG: hypothetical protein V1926_00025 [Candidatus Peregrinibacteria bacterium]
MPDPTEPDTAGISDERIAAFVKERAGNLPGPLLEEIVECVRAEMSTFRHDLSTSVVDPWVRTVQELFEQHKRQGKDEVEAVKLVRQKFGGALIKGQFF